MRERFSSALVTVVLLLLNLLIAPRLFCVFSKKHRNKNRFFRCFFFNILHMFFAATITLNY